MVTMSARPDLTEREAFSLLHRRWLPVRRADGAREFIRPAEITSAILTNPVVAIDWSRPDFDSATREFLIGLLAVACVSQITDGWSSWFHTPPSPEALDTAFAPLVRAFILDGFGSRFGQDQEEMQGDQVPVSHLLIEAPGANTMKKNLDHFVRRGRIETMSRTGAAIALFTLQDHAPAGGAGHRTSLRGGGPLTTLVIPGPLAPDGVVPLWRTLWLNVSAPSDDEDAEMRLDRVFPWLDATRCSAKAELTSPEDVHPLQAYWGMPRRIRLIFEANLDGRPCDLTGIIDSVIVRAYRTRPYGTNYARFVHPLSPYYRQKPEEELLPVHGQPGRIGYRHWVGLIESSHGNLRQPAEAVVLARRRLRLLPRSVRHNALLSSAGYDMDNMKARDFIESEMPLHLVAEAVADDFHEVIRQFVGSAHETIQLLRRQLRDAVYGRDQQSDGILAVARDRFWDETEPEFHRLASELVEDLEASATDEVARREHLSAARENWLGVIRRRALAAFDALAPMTELDGLGLSQIDRMIKARFFLIRAFKGYGKDGRVLFTALGRQVPESGKYASKEKEPA